MIVSVSPDLSKLSNMSKKNVQKIQDLLHDHREYDADNVSGKAIDISEKALTARQMRAKMGGGVRGGGGVQFINGMPMPMPFPGQMNECKMQ
jgi:ubiquinone/menaquinone biosynthesis C-methylase UbiE